MSSLKLKGSTSGDITITVPAVAGTNTVTIPAVTGTLPLSNLDHVTNRPNSKPLIINGDMAVAQRGASQTGQTANHFPVDRFGFQMDTFGTWTSSQSTDVPTGQGFATSLKLDCTTADTSLGAGHFGVIHYKFEGQDAQLLKKGTSSAEKVTISFWVKSNKTGNYVIELFDVDNSRQISQLYSISSADTWEQKIVTFAGDTSGALDNDNGNSFVIHWALGAGSTYSGGTLNTSWAANNNANRWVGGPNLADSTDNEWYLTGVQLEVGEYTASTLPPFQNESFSDSLQRCQRYYEKSYNATTDPGSATLVGVRHGSGVAGQTGTGEIAMGIYFLTPKRTTPTITLYDRSGNSGKCSRADLGTAEHTNQTASAVHTGENSFAVSSGSGSTGATIHCHFEAAVEL